MPAKHLNSCAQQQQSARITHTLPTAVLQTTETYEET